MTGTIGEVTINTNIPTTKNHKTHTTTNQTPTKLKPRYRPKWPPCDQGKYILIWFDLTKATFDIAAVLHRADSRHARSKWETSLQSNAVSHWLGANLGSALVILFSHLSTCNRSVEYVYDYHNTIDKFHKSQNAPVPYPTMLYSEHECAYFCSEWSIVGYGSGAFWDLCNRSTLVFLSYR